jgi:hypothetical protein
MRNTKLKGLIPLVSLVAVFVLALLLSWPSSSRATLTVSNAGLQGDANITVDTNGTLGIGTALATAITIGQSSLNVSIPGSLTVSSATTTVNNLKVTGSCLGCGLLSGITAINGLTNATTSLVAGTNITIATSTPNIIMISASGGTTPTGTSTQVQFNSSGAFGASANLTWLSPALTIGQTGTPTGQLKLAGSTSGTDTIQASSTAGIWTLTLPTSAGTSGYVLSTDGNGNTSWIAQSGGSSQWTSTSTGIYYNAGNVTVGTTVQTNPSAAYDSASLGGELTSSGCWTLGSGWSGTYAGGFTYSGSGGGTLSCAISSTNASVYQVGFTFARTAGQLSVSMGGATFLSGIQNSGSYQNWPAAGSGSNLVFTPNGSFYGTVSAFNVQLLTPASAVATQKDSAGAVASEVRLFTGSVSGIPYSNMFWGTGAGADNVGFVGTIGIGYGALANAVTASAGGYQPNTCFGNLSCNQLTSTVSEIRRAGGNIRGSREAAAQGIGRSEYAALRSNEGYAVGGELCVPRGRKWGGSGAARSPRWPTWAEGEKRLLSVIKKPYAAIHSVP